MTMQVYSREDFLSLDRRRHHHQRGTIHHDTLTPDRSLLSVARGSQIWSESSHRCGRLQIYLRIGSVLHALLLVAELGLVLDFGAWAEKNVCIVTIRSRRLAK
jgi:hypothetical protein